MADDPTKKKDGDPEPEPKKAAQLVDLPAETLVGMIVELRAENKERRLEIASLKEAIEVAAKNSEKDGADHKAQIAELQTKMEEASHRAVMASLAAGAARKGFTDPDDAIKLLDASKIVVKDGEVENADALLDALATEKAYLLSPTRNVGGEGAGGNGSDPKPTDDMNSWLRGAAGRPAAK